MVNLKTKVNSKLHNSKVVMDKLKLLYVFTLKKKKILKKIRTVESFKVIFKSTLRRDIASSKHRHLIICLTSTFGLYAVA